MALTITKPLVQHQSEAITMINTLAETTRLKYITNGAGQAATYLAKLTDAQNYKAAGYPIPATAYTWINAEATATGASPQVVADLVISTALFWDAKGSAIESTRQAALQQIKNATSYPAIKTTLANYQITMETL